MKERLITLETSKLIPNPKQTVYWNKCEWYYVDTFHPDGYWFGSRGTLDIDYPAPTQSLLQKWLRDEHKIQIQVEYGSEFNKYGFFIYKNNNDRIEQHIKLIQKGSNVYYIYNSYEDALEMALQLGLKAT